MKKNILLLTTFLVFINVTYAQSELNFFANELCNSFEESDLEKPKDELFHLLQNKSSKIYKNNQKELNALTSKLKDNNPDKSEREIALLVGNEISLLTIKNCPKFQRIAQKIALPEPKQHKKSVTNVKDKLCNLLKNSSDKSSATLEKILKDNFMNVLYENKELIEKEYGSFGSPEYNNDLNESLMIECDIYFKMTMGKR